MAGAYYVYIHIGCEYNYSILLYSILFYFILFYSILFYSILFYYILSIVPPTMVEYNTFVVPRIYFLALYIPE